MHCRLPHAASAAACCLLTAFALASSSSHSCMRLHVSPGSACKYATVCDSAVAVYAYLAFMPQIGRHVYGQGLAWRAETRGGRGAHDRRTWRVTAARSAFLSIKLLDISLHTRIVYAYVCVCTTQTYTLALCAHSFVSFSRKSRATFGLAFYPIFAALHAPPPTSPL